MRLRTSWLVLALAASACGAPADEAATGSEGAATSGSEGAAPADGVYGRVPRAVGGVPSVVLLEAEGVSAPARESPPKIDQFGLQFSPRFLIAPVGESMIFRNSESIAHNVMVRSVASSEMLLNADTPPGDSLLFVPEEPGGYDVGCEVHPGMTAFIYATDAPYGAFAETDGAFAISGVPAGEFTMRVWSVDPAGRSERTVRVSDGAATEVVVTPAG
jgi:plastocyanin